MLLALVGGGLRVLLSRERLGGGLAVLAVGIKLTAGLLLPFAIAAGGPRRGRGRRRDLLLGAGVALALIAALSVRPVRHRDPAPVRHRRSAARARATGTASPG